MAADGSLSSSFEDAMLLPSDVTEWLIEPHEGSEESPCPLGFICDEGKGLRANCTKIRAVTLAYGFGDVHAGGYCPEDSNRLLVCPAGYYCPTAEEIYLCPEGFYCPHKTAWPEIACSGCGVGEEVLVREWYGYFLIALILAAMLLRVVFSMLQRRRLDLMAHFRNLSTRSVDSAWVLYRRNQRFQALERLKPKLYRIQERLEQHQLENGSVSANSNNKVSSSASMQVDFSSLRQGVALDVRDGKNIRYQAGRLFEILDVDNSGRLSYDELQTVLELNPEQLKAFVRRMNQLSSDNDKSNISVSRSTFVRHFLQVLEESNHFGPTTAETEELFDHELACKDDAAFAAYADFYESSLRIFLTDLQINEMIAKFRGISKKNQLLGGRQTSLFGGGSGEIEIQHVSVAERADEEAISANAATDNSNKRRASKASIPERHLVSTRSTIGGMFGRKDARNYVHRSAFLEYYGDILKQVTTEVHASHRSVSTDDFKENPKGIEKESRGVDLAFEDLCLAVNVGDKSINVVNHVTGRLPAKTMTALMGGSGAGKTSLLNALCGRAFYGSTTGTIKINGHVASIEDHMDATGFVPQDDIVHSELTVRENLIYSGKFTLPTGTLQSEIEDYADEVLAQLGLSRVANSIVGDVNRRGVSGGEKKRVNIGVELMSKPSILFLDEPTSGLDSSSALLVMSSLKTLVESQGVTICSVIHQPRKAIFDAFDSLILLGVGGNMVYHGPVTKAEEYFSKLPEAYHLPKGESLADWLIDVSSGRLVPSRSNENGSENQDDEDGNGEGTSLISTHAGLETTMDLAKERRQTLYVNWKEYFESVQGREKSRYAAPEAFPLPTPTVKPTFTSQLTGQIHRNLLMAWRNRTVKLVDTMMIVGAVVLISALQGVTELTRSQEPNLSFDELVEGDPMEIPKTFPELFRYALSPTPKALEYGLKVGVIASVLLGLTAAKVITSKRLEFFREAGSGYDINAYFLAVNVTSTIEHFVQILIAAGCAYWLRDSTTMWYAFVVQFELLMWITVSWSLLIPLLVPPNNVVLAVGFFNAFFGLLFAGVIEPVRYREIYAEGNDAMAVFAGLLSVTRFFIEGMTVQEQRCLPPQSGFTLEQTSVNFPIEHVNSFTLIGVAQNDLSVVKQSCTGWYWSVGPVMMVGIMLRFVAAGALHVSDRPRQNKKSLWQQIRNGEESGLGLKVAAYVVWLLVLLALSCWFILGTRGDSGLVPREEALAELDAVIGLYLSDNAADENE